VVNSFTFQAKPAPLRSSVSRGSARRAPSSTRLNKGVGVGVGQLYTPVLPGSRCDLRRNRPFPLYRRAGAPAGVGPTRAALGRRAGHFYGFAGAGHRVRVSKVATCPAWLALAGAVTSVDKRGFYGVPRMPLCHVEALRHSVLIVFDLLELDAQRRADRLEEVFDLNPNRHRCPSPAIEFVYGCN
jgi:hypothetical protein